MGNKDRFAEGYNPPSAANADRGRGERGYEPANPPKPIPGYVPPPPPPPPPAKPAPSEPKSK